jgi:hypothetical protein
VGLERLEGEWSAAYDAVVGAGGDVAVTCNYSKSADWDTRMVCVNADGKTTVVPMRQLSTVLTVGILLVSSDEFAHIKQFQLQRRSYEWVEFRNVSLQPGYATRVEIKDAGVGTKRGRR